MSKLISLRRVKRMWRRTRHAVRRAPRWQKLICVSFFAVLSWEFVLQQQVMNLNYTKLLDAIAQGESRGNYNAYFGNAGNHDIQFTSMTIGQVIAWQHAFVAEGHASSALGKYQFIDTTLEGLVREMHIESSARFDAALQDQLAIQLVKRRGVEQYARGDISREQFAYNLSKEWAALPRVVGGDPTASYYDGDGVNHARVSINTVLAAIDALKSTA